VGQPRSEAAERCCCEQQGWTSGRCDSA